LPCLDQPFNRDIPIDAAADKHRTQQFPIMLKLVFHLYIKLDLSHGDLSRQQNIKNLTDDSSRSALFNFIQVEMKQVIQPSQ
jgi:hypothetical protein